MRRLLDSDRFKSLTIVPRFRHVPVVKGIRGYDNQEYSDGLKNAAKNMVRKFANRVIPGLWI
jgi:hypothetical protein